MCPDSDCNKQLNQNSQPTLVPTKTSLNGLGSMNKPTPKFEVNSTSIPTPEPVLQSYIA
jgi:hypothetical protein